MSILQSFKIQGQTTGAVAIATKDIEIHSDGYVRYLDSNSRPRSMKISGNLARFFKEALTGAGGLTVTLMD
jgi:hypothetical protein